MTIGTNYPTGLVTRKKFSGSTAVTDTSRLRASTKFVKKTAVIRCDAQTTETQTDFTLPTDAIVHDVFLNIIVADPTETVSVGTQGTSNDDDGYLIGAALAPVGLKFGSLADGAVTRGALLLEATEAVGASPTRKPDITAGGDPISYTCSAGSDTAIFDIIIEYTEVVIEAN